MSRYSVIYGDDTMIVELGQPSDPILVDGQQIGRQCADGSCRTDACIRIALAWAYGTTTVYETEEEAANDGRKPGDNIVIWDDVEYERAEDVDDVEYERAEDVIPRDGRTTR